MIEFRLNDHVHFISCAVLSLYWAHAQAKTNLAGHALNQGDYVRAEALQQEAPALSREIGDRVGIDSGLMNLAFWAFARNGAALRTSPARR